MNGGQIVAESNNSRTIVYIYDASGAPIGMMYRTTSYAKDVWDTFWYEKNLQGDIVETELLLSPRAQQRISDTSNRAKINNTNYLDKIMYA